MPSRIRLYARQERTSPLVRTGRTFANLQKALARAAALGVDEVEVRDDTLPRSRSLLAIFVEGHRIGAA